MKTHFRSPILAGAVSLALLSGCLLMTPIVLGQSTEGVEELTRGPVHEAFAGSISYDPEPGLIIDRESPKLIEELAPEQRPAGDNVAWIPGYWGWDEDRSDFIWISGVWRNIPPGREWVPGYWNPVDGRWQWISGYWELTEERETAYLPPPPKSVENGPSSEAPSENHIWISGNWQYTDDRYAWRTGYWEPARDNWIWVPAHYRWTPRGYVFIEGYWDYDVPRRGMIFAPVYFDHGIYSRPDYYYTPVTVIALNVFARHLFVRPRYSHYYFGDYYEPRYLNSGFHASFHYHRDRRGYDPFYAHDRWHHRNDRDWDRRRRDDYDFYRNNRDARPPHTLAALLQRPENERRGRRDDFELARPLSRVIEDKDARRNFVKVDRKEITERSRQIRDFGRERGKLESRGEGPRKIGDRPVREVREKLGRSPVASRRIEDLKGDDAPPPRLERRPEINVGRNEKPGASRPDAPPNPGAGRNEPQRDRKMDAPERDRRTPGKEAENIRRPDTGPSAPKREQKADPAPSRPTPTKREPGMDPSTPRRQPETRPDTPKREVTPGPRREPERPKVNPPQQRREIERRQEPQRQETRPQQRPSVPEQRKATPQSPRKIDRPQVAPQRQEQRPQATPQRQQRQEQRQQAAPQRQQRQEQRQQAASQRSQRQEQRPQATPQRPQRQEDRKKRN
jgi:hypothetical protein